jgi:hypothetical protein
MTVWEIQPLDGSRDRAEFDCGHPPLNQRLQPRAGQWDRKELARRYAAVRPGESKVLGYYAISSHHVSFQALPDAGPRRCSRAARLRSRSAAVG